MVSGCYIVYWSYTFAVWKNDLLVIVILFICTMCLFILWFWEVHYQIGFLPRFLWKKIHEHLVLFGFLNPDASLSNYYYFNLPCWCCTTPWMDLINCNAGMATIYRLPSSCTAGFRLLWRESRLIMRFVYSWPDSILVYRQ